MVEKTILVTGVELEREAQELLAKHSITTIYTGTKVDSDTIVQMAARHQIVALIVRQGVICDRVLDASDRLLVVSRHGAGVDRIDLAAATQRGIPVLRAVGANAASVSEFTIGLIFALIKQFADLDGAVRTGLWPKQGFIGRDIAGIRLGVVGYGAVGKKVANMAHLLGMDVRVFDPRADVHEHFSKSHTLDDLLAKSDVVTLHCPLNNENRRMIDDRALRIMPKGSFLINTARGGLVDDDALVAALESGQLAGAAVDSYEQEPPTDDNILRRARNIILTPHVAGAGRSGLVAMGLSSVQNALDAILGTPISETCLANHDVIKNLPKDTKIVFKKEME